MLLFFFLAFYQINSLFIVVKEGSLHCILETIPQDVAFLGTLSTAPLQEQLGMTHSYVCCNFYSVTSCELPFMLGFLF